MLKCLISIKQSFWVLVLLSLGIPVFVPQKIASSSNSLPLSATTESVCPADLENAISSIIQRWEYQRSHWGILIETLDSQQTLYTLNAQKYFIPASNIKLLTSAAVLLQFGSDYRIRTSVYANGTPPTLETLYIIGNGDPTITTQKLRELAKQIKQKGVRQINQLIVVESYSSNVGIHPSWEWEDIFFDYAVSINSLILNENAVTLKASPQQLGQPLKLSWSDSIAARQWTIENQTFTASENTANTLTIRGFLGTSRLLISGQLAINAQEDTFGIAIPQPSQYFLDSFQDVLITEGIRVKKSQVKTDFFKPELGQEITFIESPFLTYLLEKVNQESNNLYAETLLQWLGSLDVLKQRLTELGVNAESYRIVDGSGLSRHNLATPETFVQTLQLMSKTSQFEVYKNSLSIAGIKGTLKGRFSDTNIQGYLYGKTGTLSGASSLSGYLLIPNHQPLVFSIIVNHSEQPAVNLRQGIDEIVLLLGKLKRC